MRPVARQGRPPERYGPLDGTVGSRAGLEDDGLHDLAVFSLLDDEI